MNGNFFKGLGYMAQGFQIILQPGFRLFLFVPLLVNVLLFSFMIMWAYSLIDGWMASLLSWLPEWLAFLEWLFWGAYFGTLGYNRRFESTPECGPSVDQG